MRKSYQGKHLRRLAAAVCAALLAGAAGFAPVLYAHPILDSKDAAVSIATNGNVMDITSTAQDNLIKWVDFSISGGKTVDFHDKNYLNYVTGSAVSDIQGILKGTGNIYLVNPNGILIGDGATVNVGSLHLSTKNLDVGQLTDYNTGLNLLTSATAAGDVINMGRLNATSISVEGKNITFKNVADVNNGSAANVKLTANSGGEIHLGFANETEAANVNNSEYTAVNEPTLTGWTTSGTTHKYMLVRNKYELQNMQNNLAGNYMLAKSIDMNGFENFKPIGNFDSRFVGKFDGLNHTIQNLNINKSTNSDIGLFGCNSGKIENVGMVGGSITGLYRVGGLVGSNYGTIKHVYNTGTVNGTDEVGGIAGQNNDSTIGIAYNTGAVSGNGNVGGIAGQNNGGTIGIAYNTGTVTGTDRVGGLVGQNGGTVENAYNTEAVNGTRWVGGLVGQNGGTVENAYNTEAVNGTRWVGGLVGQNGGTVTKAYSSSDGNLKQAATFSDFGFVNGVSSDGVWRIYDGQTMPLLTAFLTRKDHITDTTVYNGTKDAGATYETVTTPTTFSAENAQFGYNYVKDVSIVTPKDLTVSFGASPAKIYDGTTEATAGTATLDGIVNSDAVSLADGVTANFADKNVGTGKTVNYSGIALTGDKAKNYNLVNAATATGSGTISKADVKISVDNYSRAYDGTTDASGATLKTVDGAIFAGDTLSGGTLAFTDKNAGTGKTITVADVTVNDGNGGNNYNVTYQDGTGEITRRPLSLTANPVSITQGEAVPASFSGTLTGFAEGEGLAEGDSYAFNLSGTPTAVGKYAITGTLSIGGGDPAESGDYGTNYTFANAAANATAFTIAAKYVPPAPGGGSSGSSSGTSGTSGGAAPIAPTMPINPTPTAPTFGGITPEAPVTPVNPASAAPVSGGNATPASPGAAPGSNGGNGSGINTLIAAGTEAAPLLLATVTETENIAAAAAAGARAEMSQAAAEAAVSGIGTAAPRPAESAAATAPQGFTWAAEGLIAIANDVNPAPQDALSPQSLGHALSTLQHGSGEEQAPGERGSAKGLEEAIEAADLAIGTEIAETDREGKAADEDKEARKKAEQEQG